MTFVTVMVAVSAVLASSMSHAVAQSSCSASSDADIVLEFVNGVFGAERNASVIDAYISEDHQQHNPTSPNGRPAYTAIIEGEFTFQAGQVISQGGLVAIHGRYAGFGPTPLIAFDMWRVEDGMIVEHWDVLQNETAASNTTSGNAMFDAVPGALDSAPSGACDAVSTEDVEIVKEFVKGVFGVPKTERNVSLIEKYISTDHQQHNPGSPNGRPAYTTIIEEDFSYEAGEIVASGGFVLIHGRYTGLGPKPLIAFDLWRVADGMIVEHWDALQDEVPANESTSGNPMFTPVPGALEPSTDEQSTTSTGNQASNVAPSTNGAVTAGGTLVAMLVAALAVMF